MKLINSGFGQVAVVMAIVVVVVIGLVAYGLSKSSPKPTPGSSACVNQTLSSSSSGSCVSDAQNLVNWAAYGIDTPNYIKISGSYDSPTLAAVKVFQKNSGIAVTGNISPSDWKSLCSYSSDAPSSWVIASKAAGC